MIDLEGTELVAPQRAVVVVALDLPRVALGLDAPDVVANDRGRVVAVGPRARAAGVRLGSSLAAVRARSGELVVAEADPGTERRALDELRDALATVSPAAAHVAGVQAVGIWVRAAVRYYGSEAVLLERVRATVRTRPWARVGIGDSVAAAVVAALDEVEHAPGCSIAELGFHDVGELLPFWLSVPLAAVGIRQIAGFQRLEAAAVAARFGERGMRWHRLVRLEADLALLGERLEPPRALVVEVAEEETLEGVRFRLLGALGRMVEEHPGALPSRWRAWVALEGGALRERLVERPVGASLAEVGEVVNALLGAARDGAVPPELVGVEVLAWTSPQPPQLSLDGVPGARQAAVRQVLQVLQRRYGAGSVLVAGTGMVGRAFVDRRPWVPWVGAWPLVHAAGCTSDPWPGQVPGVGPTWVPSALVPVDLCDGAGSDVEVDGDGVLSSPPALLRTEGEVEEVVGIAGPWVVRERWWERRRARYARLLVRTSARWCWLRRERGSWWLEGDYE